MKIWIFGASNCLAWKVTQEQSWPHLVSSHFNGTLVNMAADASDNLLIYHKINKTLDQIRDEDIVIVGWSHPNRKTFVFDQTNPTHQAVIDGRCIIYQDDPIFFRSDNIGSSDSWQKWLSFKPKNQGIEFFDRWFLDYFSDHESRLNLQAYIDSTAKNLSHCRYRSFYFSQESTNCIKHVDPDSLFYLDFVIKNNIAISKNDAHATSAGHRMIADLFIKSLTSA